MEPADEPDDYLPCAACEWGTIPPTERAPDGSPLYEDGTRGTCPNCGAVSIVTSEEDGPAYTLAVECKHGRSMDDECGLCEAGELADGGDDARG